MAPPTRGSFSDPRVAARWSASASGAHPASTFDFCYLSSCSTPCLCAARYGAHSVQSLRQCQPAIRNFQPVQNALGVAVLAQITFRSRFAGVCVFTHHPDAGVTRRATQPTAGSDLHVRRAAEQVHPIEHYSYPVRVTRAARSSGVLAINVAEQTGVSASSESVHVVFHAHYNCAIAVSSSLLCQSAVLVCYMARA